MTSNYQPTHQLKTYYIIIMPSLETISVERLIEVSIIVLAWGLRDAFHRMSTVLFSMMFLVHSLPWDICDVGLMFALSYLKKCAEYPLWIQIEEAGLFFSKNVCWFIYELLCICFNSFQTASLNHTGRFLGCFGMSGNNASLTYSGLAGFTQIEQKKCIKRCSDLGFAYAAIQSSILCFCTDNFTKMPFRVGECLLPYSFETFLPNVAMLVYRRPTQALTVVNVSLSHDQKRLGENFAINSVVNNHEVGSVSLEADFGDGNKVVFCNSVRTYFYKNPGSYKVFMTFEDLTGNQLNFTRYIKIADNLTKLELECPRIVAQGSTVHCQATIARGLKMSGNVTVEDKQIKLNQIPGNQSDIWSDRQLSSLNTILQIYCWGYISQFTCMNNEYTRWDSGYLA